MNVQTNWANFTCESCEIWCLHRVQKKICEMEPRGDGVIYWLLIKFLFFTPLPWCNRNVKRCYAFIAIDMSVALVRRIELECAFLILYDSMRGDEAARARMLRLRSLPSSWVGFFDGEGRKKPVNKKFSGEKRVTNVYRQSSQITSVFSCCSCVLTAHTCRTVYVCDDACIFRWNILTCKVLRLCMAKFRHCLC